MPDMIAEKYEEEQRRRLYYQDIVYQVCNSLDRFSRAKPGGGIVCGTAESPSTAVQDRVGTLVTIATLYRYRLEDQLLAVQQLTEKLRAQLQEINELRLIEQEE